MGSGSKTVSKEDDPASYSSQLANWIKFHFSLFPKTQFSLFLYFSLHSFSSFLFTYFVFHFVFSFTYTFYSNPDKKCGDGLDGKNKKNVQNKRKVLREKENHGRASFTKEERELFA